MKMVAQYLAEDAVGFVEGWLPELCRFIPRVAKVELWAESFGGRLYAALIDKSGNVLVRQILE